MWGLTDRICTWQCKFTVFIASWGFWIKCTGEALLWGRESVSGIPRGEPSVATGTEHEVSFPHRSGLIECRPFPFLSFLVSDGFSLPSHLDASLGVPGMLPCCGDSECGAHSLQLQLSLPQGSKNLKLKSPGFKKCLQGQCPGVNA